jgi:peptidyl-prolyl cis-trans isomerase SurA
MLSPDFSGRYVDPQSPRPRPPRGSRPGRPFTKEIAMRRLAMFFLAAAVAASVNGQAPADTSIKVLVNDQPITSYDISQRQKLMQIAREKGGSKEAMEQLIDEAIQVQEAKKRGLVIPDKDIDRFFADIAQKNAKMSVSQFTQALNQAGIAPATLKRRIKAQATWGQLVQGKARATTKVKSDDIVAAMFAKQDQASMKVTEYKLQQIIFIVPEAKKSPEFVAQRRREAEAFRGRFAGCDKSVEQVKALRDVVVVNLGRRDTTQLDGPQGDEIKATSVGKLTRPNTGNKGVELIAVCDTREMQSDAAVRAETESKLMLDQAKGLGAEYLKELRKTAVIVYR